MSVLIHFVVHVLTMRFLPLWDFEHLRKHLKTSTNSGTQTQVSRYHQPTKLSRQREKLVNCGAKKDILAKNTEVRTTQRAGA